MGMMKYLKFTLDSFVGDIQTDIKGKKFISELETFKGKSCLVRKGGYNPEDGSFDHNFEKEVSNFNCRYDDSFIDILDGDKLVTHFDVEDTEKVYLGDEGIVFNVTEHRGDVLITRN